ncbi:MAG TPA: hypothetical protein VJV39_27845 [Dongiaceae bacterium]|nr:hypothetical protein [Dongiaceae bacterium]
MKAHSFIAAIAALTLSTLALTASDATAAKIIEITGKYSKIKLDGICSANGGNSYGTADTAYGCSKGNVTVECQKDGSCKGYVFMKAASGHGQMVSPGAVLQQSDAPQMRSTIRGAAGGTLTQQ